MNPLLKLAVKALREAAEERAAPRMAAKALPAPPKVLALPKPAPKLDPRFKPKGGQWYPNTAYGPVTAEKAGITVHDRGPHAPEGARFQVLRPDGSQHRAPTTREHAEALADRLALSQLKNLSPEEAASQSSMEMALKAWEPEGEGVHRAVTATNGVPPDAWLRKALTKYYKTDFGTEADPLAQLAGRGLHYDPDMTPDKWIDTANSSLMEDPIGYFTVPPHATAGGSYDPVIGPQLLQDAPWLAKAPVTDNLYGISSPLDLGHFADEMHNALNADTSGLPSSLAVRPESLQRMSFPQAVEHVGRINQFRAKEMERASAAALSNPAIHPHKDYGDGMRWVELKQPDASDLYKLSPQQDATGAQFWQATDPDTGEVFPLGGSREQAIESLKHLAPREHLSTALKHEGDTMGHCVGGYCDDVASGASRIYSLRDVKGQPHVTVETSPGATRLGQMSDRELQANPDLWAARMAYAQAPMSETSSGGGGGMAGWLTRQQSPLLQQYPELFEKGQDIVQIKGKQNRAPNPEYLPYVQDFVKGGQWGRIGDLGNTGLTKLPDGRLVREGYYADLRNSLGTLPRDPRPREEVNWRNANPATWDYWHHDDGTFGVDPSTWAPSKDEWDAIKHVAPDPTNYARGGRVDLAVRRAA